MAGCSLALLHLHRDWAHPPRASAPGLGSPPARICTGTAGASRGHAEACAAVSTGSDRCAHTRDSVRRARGAIDTPCLCFVFACVRACVPVFGFCLNAPACLPHACDVSARARLHSAGVCTAGRPDAVPPGRAQVLQLARRGGADRISLSERNYTMQRRACPISAMQRRAGRHKRDASGAHLRRRSLSKPIAARAAEGSLRRSRRW